jgi:hypothetical protein
MYTLVVDAATSNEESKVGLLRIVAALELIEKQASFSSFQHT